MSKRQIIKVIKHRWRAQVIDRIWDYFMGQEVWLDASIIFVFVLIASMRLTTLWGNSELWKRDFGNGANTTFATDVPSSTTTAGTGDVDGGTNEVNSGTLNTDSEVLYVLLTCILSVLLGFKLLVVFSLSPSIGVLLRVITKMYRDVRNFFVLYLCALVGFVFVFLRLGRDQLQLTHSNVASASFDLTFSMIGEFDKNFKQNWDALGDTRSLVNASALESMTAENAPQEEIHLIGTQLWLLRGFLAIFLLFSNVIMLNLLIAMMGKTYSSVIDESAEEFSLGQTEVYWKYDQNRYEVPPPLNVLVTLLSSIIYLFMKLWKVVEFGCSSLYWYSRCQSGHGGRQSAYQGSYSSRSCGNINDHAYWRCVYCFGTSPTARRQMKTCQHCLRYKRCFSSYGVLEASLARMAFIVFMWLPLMFIAVPLLKCIGTHRPRRKKHSAAKTGGCCSKVVPRVISPIRRNSSTSAWKSGTSELVTMRMKLVPMNELKWRERLMALANDNSLGEIFKTDEKRQALLHDEHLAEHALRNWHNLHNKTTRVLTGDHVKITKVGSQTGRDAIDPNWHGRSAEERTAISSVPAAPASLSLSHRIIALEEEVMGERIMGGTKTRLEALEDAVLGEVKRGAMSARVSALEVAYGLLPC
jgi:hypothetical protein